VCEQLYLLVTYIYSAEDSLAAGKGEQAGAAEEETKSFSFWTQCKLGDATAASVLTGKSRISNVGDTLAAMGGGVQ
jgi:hypothetical protein